MRVSVIVAAFAASVVSASTLTVRQGGGIPTCAIPCLTDPNAPLGDCQSTDNTCLCKNQAFIQYTTTCVEKACSGNDLTTAEAASVALCKAAGVDITGSGTSAPSSSTAGASVGSAPASTSAAPSPSATKSAGSAVSVGRNVAALGGLAAAVSLFL